MTAVARRSITLGTTAGWQISVESGAGGNPVAAVGDIK